MNRVERWVVVVLLGSGIFAADASVRAAAPSAIACIRTGTIGLLRAEEPSRQVATQAGRESSNADFRAEIEQAKKMARTAYDEGLIAYDLDPKGTRIKPSGFSIAVAVNGKVMWAQGFGYADLEQKVPVTSDTKFRIGSVSKPLTAAAVALLSQQGKLDVDAPVQHYVPTFPDKGVAITTREVGGHLAGFRHYKDGEFETCAHYENVVDSLDIFKNDPLIAPPGTKFSYSSYGFNLISAVVRGASDKGFRDYMHENVFMPLGMKNTVPDEEDTIIPNRARFYNYTKKGTYENAPLTDNSYKWAGGGFLSTPSDLVTFGSALLHPGFLNEDSLKLLFTRQHTNAGAPIPYAFGWFIHDKAGEARVFEHSGGATGGSAHLLLYPDQGVVVAWTMNTTGLNTGPLDGIGRVFVNRVERGKQQK
ncbi:MAG: serine hydrolase domain-containing protein [Acidobacteriaceae bacterium]